MKLLGDKIIIRITKENRESIYSKEITRTDGSKTRLFINVPTDAIDERHSTLFVQTGIVEAVSEKVKGIKVGDIALLDYQLCNSKLNFFQKDENGELFWINATTTYHEFDEIAYQTRRSKRDQIIAKKGEIDEISFLLGIIRGDKLIARDPYIFLENLPTTIVKTMKSGIVYQEKQTVLTRRVLAVPEEMDLTIKEGDKIIVNDSDIFLIQFDGKSIDCIQAEDVLAVEKEADLKAV